MAYPVPPRNRDQFAGVEMHKTTNKNSCLKHRHGRFFDDNDHFNASDHKSLDEFILVQFHRETIGFGLPPRHKINESAGQSRRVMTRRMSRGAGPDHDVDDNFIRHPGQRGMTGGKPNDRKIGRVSHAHRSE